MYNLTDALQDLISLVKRRWKNGSYTLPPLNTAEQILESTISEHEKRELDEWIELSEENIRLFENLTDEIHLKNLFEIDVKEEQKSIIRMYEEKTGNSISKGSSS